MLKTTLASHYQLVKLLGRGAFGTTYLAKDLHLPGHPLCAVKKLNPTNRNKRFLDVARRLFNSEAEVLQKLGQHSQIPRLLAYFEEKSHFYLVQEFIEGHSLSKELILGESWSETNVILFLSDCLNILEFIHDRGVIHRDIKPNNLIRRQADNKFVLIDFGAVKQVMLQNEVFSTISIGTKGYMPGEQAMGKPRFSSDIYAVGIIAIQALTGTKPQQFQEDENGEIIWQERTKNINPKLIKIINKMTRSHFNDRYNSAREVLKDLESLPAKLIFFRHNYPKFSTDKKLESPLIILENSVKQTKKNNFFTLKILSAASLLTLLLLAWLGINLYKDRRQQEQIDSFLNSLQSNYRAKKYQSCLATVKNKPPEINVPQDKIEEFIGKCNLGLAETKALKNDLTGAIARAKEIPENNLEAEEKIKEWSQQILDRLFKIYQQEGNLNKIEQIIDNLPDNTEVKQTALKLKHKWEEEIAVSKKNLADTDRFIKNQKWADAIEKAAEIKTVNNSVYWQKKAEKIIAKAKNNRQKELAIYQKIRKIKPVIKKYDRRRSLVVVRKNKFTIPKSKPKFKQKN